MGSIEMAVLNVVHAKGEYWELWRGDGINVETTAAISNAWEEARKLGMTVYDVKGRRLGRIKDAALVPLVHPSRVDRFLIGAGLTWIGSVVEGTSGVVFLDGNEELSGYEHSFSE